MRWDKTGRLIMIPDEKALVENVCKVHFSQQNITSFVRPPSLAQLLATSSS